ncbi:hypothetical protein BH10ACT1_BH10ACT1_23240 [soil metagenome]
MPETPRPVSPDRVERRWPLLLATVVALGLVVRTGYVLLVVRHTAPGLDAVWYQLQGSSIRQGTGYVVPNGLFTGRTVPTAGFPPVYPAYQAAWQWCFGPGPTSVRLAGLVPGGVTIALAGLLGRSVAGARVGLLAALLVALDPTLIAVDGATMSENVTVPLVLVAVLLGHRVATSGTRTTRVVALGLVCGLAATSRQDLLLLLPLVAAPAVLWAPPSGWRTGLPRRAGALAAAMVLAALVVLPWAVRNEREVGAFTVSTTSPSSALAGSNCERTFYGADLGGWSFACVAEATGPPGAAESEVASRQQHAAATYVRNHLGRLPVVLVARQGRVWSLWSPTDLARRDAEESRRYGWQLATEPVAAALSVVGAIGLVGLVRRHGRRTLLVVVPPVLVVVTAAVTHGNPRFAAIAHPVLALGVAGLVDRWWCRRRAPTVPLELS